MGRIGFLQFVILSVVLIISACDRTVTERIGVSVDTNAYYTAYQKNPDEPWTQINFNNTEFVAETLSFALDEPTDPYAVVFVCPSKRRNVPHKVYAYYATPAEMTLLDFTCKKPPQDILQSSIYGTIAGVTPATLSNPRGELVNIALSSSQSLTTLEAFAARVSVGTHDVVAVKGMQSVQGNFIESPKQFSILRGFKLLGEESQEANFGFDGLTSYTAPFNSADVSSVTIEGVKPDDKLTTQVAFLTRNKSLLRLALTDKPALTFIPVPLDDSTGPDIGGFYNENEFQPGEGHELSATVTGVDGKIEREVRKFFTRSDASHKLTLPAPITSVPALSLTAVDVFQKITAVWLQYESAETDNTRLYRWIFEGTAAKLNADKAADVEVTKVQWIVHTTPGWLNYVSRTEGTFSISLPEKYDSVAIEEGERVEVWSDAWSFQANTPVDWELSVFSTDENGNSGAVVEYLLNRNIVENYRFSQAYLRSSLSP